jgi:hypothetical protein
MKLFNVTSTIISAVALPCDTEEEALALIKAGNVDLIKEARAITNITLENGIEQEDVEAADDETDAETFLIPQEIREKILEDQNFLRDYANMTFTGDGLEYDHAAELLVNVDDGYLLECYRASSHDNEDQITALRALNNGRINKILDEEEN